MRMTARKPALPKDWSAHPDATDLLAEADITVCRRGRLRAKVLLFRNAKALQRNWRLLTGNPLGRGALGAVNSLMRECYASDGKRVRLEGDPRYFCVIGLVRGHLSMEVISHEAVHAGFAYEKRCKRSLFAGVDDLDEERVAYPAGRIAAGINRWLHHEGLYEAK